MKTGLRYSIEIDQNKCTGCQACVLACSYHHSKVFCLTNKSSIEIFRDNKNGNVEVSIDQSSCDMCLEEETPLCMQFCAIEAIKFIRKRKEMT